MDAQALLGPVLEPDRAPLVLAEVVQVRVVGVELEGREVVEPELQGAGVVKQRDPRRDLRDEVRLAVMGRAEDVVGVLLGDLEGRREGPEPLGRRVPARLVPLTAP